MSAEGKARNKQPPMNYDKMIKERSEYKKKADKLNVFIDHSQPEFISTMSRTMDAFDTRMQTFGGIQAQNKKNNYDKFISEKRGFIRTSNGYANNNPFEITKNEIKTPIQGPGPAF